MAQLVSSSRMGNLNSWLYRAASVKTLQKSENGGRGSHLKGRQQPGDQKGAGQGQPGAQESISVSAQRNEITETVSELGAIYLG